MRPIHVRSSPNGARRSVSVAATGVVMLAAFSSCGRDAESAPPWSTTVRPLLGDDAVRFRSFRSGGLELLVEDTAGWNADQQAAQIFEAFAAARSAFEAELDLVVPGLDGSRPARAIVAGSSKTYGRISGARGVLDREATRDRRACHLPEQDAAVFTRDFGAAAVTAFAAESFVARFRSGLPAESRARGLVDEAIYGRYLGVVRSAAADESVGTWNYDFGRIDPNWIVWNCSYAGVLLPYVDARPGSWPKTAELTAALEHMSDMDSNRRSTLRRLIWLLDVFLRDFAVDDEGFVRFDRPGEYRDVWRTIIRKNLQAGVPPLDLPRALTEARVDVPQLDARFSAWLDWVSRKISIRHFDHGRLIPFDQYRNKRGQATGDRDDDRLAVK